MNNSKEFLGTEPIGKLLFKLAVPSVIAQIVNMLYNIVDRIYIGHIPGSGSLALTGVGVCLPIIMVVSAFAALVGSGGAPRASIFMGKDDMDSAEKILSGCFTVQIIISAILTAVLLLFGRSMLLTFGASENTIDYAVDYMSIYAVGTIFVQMTLGMNMFITAQGFSKTSMLTVTIGAVCNIILDPDLYLRAWHGRKGRSSCDDHLSGGILRLGSRVPDRKEDLFTDQKGVFKAGSVYRFPVSCAGTFHICDAVQ